ncbi:MAG TPA: hypothetical protein PKI94_04655 [Candidatus Gastranaerophilaceae bacterium]|nr:hypothetical protein [Candidatus Gastranaerophilaceae bacterium]
MGFLIAAYRKQDIIRRKYDLEFKEVQLQQLLNDLLSYSSSIADGSVSLSDLSNAPVSVFNRMSNYMTTSHNGSLTTAQQQLSMYKASGQLDSVDAQYRQQYEQMLLKQLYDRERERYQKIEEKILNEKEKKLTAEKTKIDEQLKLLNAELDEVNKLEDASAKQSAPKFGLG